MHVHATVWEARTCPLSVGLMDAPAVEPSYVGMMATPALAVTATLSPKPNSLLIF